MNATTERSRGVRRNWRSASLLALIFALGLGAQAKAQTPTASAVTTLAEGSTREQLWRAVEDLRQSLKLAVPVGSIVAYGGELNDKSRLSLSAQGWLACEGRELREADYPQLFEAIGRAYGGDPARKVFLLPDFRGRFLRGVDAGAGRDPDAAKRVVSAVGGNSADSVGSRQDDELKLHAHSVWLRSSADQRFWLGGGGDARVSAESGERGAVAKTVSETGGAETRPKNVNVNWLIRAEPVFPPRAMPEAK